MSPIVLPAMPEAAEQSWLGLLDMADAVPDRWALVGGQMVHLHCWERGVSPQRATRDGDVVLDVRAWPYAAQEFTTMLRDLGFAPAGTTWKNRQYRWERDRGQVDVLIARFLGKRAQNRLGIDGGTLLPTPGATSALIRVQPVDVRLGGRNATILRPSLLGALIIKATAYVELHDDKGRSRHLSDFAILVSMTNRNDLADLRLTKLEARRLRLMIAILSSAGPTLATTPGAQDGVQRLERAMARPR